MRILRVRRAESAHATLFLSPEIFIEAKTTVCYKL
jgi:hypothetical protein